MRTTIYAFIFLINTLNGISQNQYYVSINGVNSGDGSFTNPWNLQTALSSKDKIKGGDIIWLHEGIYNGRFVSSIFSKDAKYPIQIKPYKNAKVVLNGNVKSKLTSVLTVRGANVRFEGFEITFLGQFSRNARDANFQKVAGISHNSGQDCQFVNIRIYNVPGTGFGSWKKTGGSLIQDCMIYNNGYMSTKRGSGVGIYVQNESNKTRLIKNNLIFNNYYKGIEVWSASSGKKFEFVKNVALQDNVLFNNGNPGGIYRDNIIVATGDREGINVAKNIKIRNNILYHNTDFVNNQVNGDAASLTIGFNKNAPAKDILVEGNTIIGRNNALRLLHAKDLRFKNNTVYSGYVFQTASTNSYAKSWRFDNNKYFTKKKGAFRIIKTNIDLSNWRTKFSLDENSTWKHIRDFNMKNALKVSRLKSDPYKCYVTFINKERKNVIVNLSTYGIKRKSKYRIYDVENPNKILISGKLGKKRRVVFPMNSVFIEGPLHNEKTTKTLNNFGVYIVEFKAEKTSLFERLFSK
jgi:hypothetical protein